VAAEQKKKTGRPAKSSGNYATKTWNCTQIIPFVQIDQGTRPSSPSRRRELVQAARQ
jgi:hypothetical protein